MDSYTLARYAHAAIIDRIAEIQRRLVANFTAREMFGRDALTAHRLFRNRDNALGAAPELMRLEEETLERELNKLLPTAREMEAIFETAEAGRMDAFAAFFADRFRAAAAAETEKPPEE